MGEKQYQKSRAGSRRADESDSGAEMRSGRSGSSGDSDGSALDEGGFAPNCRTCVRPCKDPSNRTYFQGDYFHTKPCYGARKWFDERVKNMAE